MKYRCMSCGLVAAPVYFYDACPTCVECMIKSENQIPYNMVMQASIRKCEECGEVKSLGHFPDSTDQMTKYKSRVCYRCELKKLGGLQVDNIRDYILEHYKDKRAMKVIAVDVPIRAKRNNKAPTLITRALKRRHNKRR